MGPLKSQIDCGAARFSDQGNAIAATRIPFFFINETLKTKNRNFEIIIQINHRFLFSKESFLWTAKNMREGPSSIAALAG